MKTIFLDTNVFLHFKLFDHIPWYKILNTDKVKIIIAPIVISELDEHKYNERAKIRKRAKNILSKLHNYIGNGSLSAKINGKLNLVFITKQPSKETFSNFKLNHNSQDDHLLACILEYCEENTEENVILVTSDIGPILKANSLKIQTLKMPDEYLLPFETDKNTKKIKKLEQENYFLKNIMPDTKLFFKNKQTTKTFFIKSALDIDDNYIEKKINSLKSKFPPKAFEENKNPKNVKEKWNFGLNELISTLSYKKEFIEQYNNELKDFYDKHESYLVDYIIYLNIKRLSFNIDLYICNDGNSPAEDIDLFLHFPNGFELSKKSDFVEKPKKPYPPRMRKLFDFNIPIPHLTSFHNINPGSLKVPNVSRPTIKKTHSFEVSYNIKHLKHNQCEKLDTLVVTFNYNNELINFSIDYKIQASNIPNEITGKLNVLVKGIYPATLTDIIE